MRKKFTTTQTGVAFFLNDDLFKLIYSENRLRFRFLRFGAVRCIRLIIQLNRH